MFGLFKSQRSSISPQAAQGIRDVGKAIVAAAANKETNADIARLQFAAEEWIRSMLPHMSPFLRSEMERALAKADVLMNS